MNKFKSLILLTTLVLFSTIVNATDFIVINDRKDPITAYFIVRATPKKMLKLQKGEIKYFSYKLSWDTEPINTIQYLIGKNPTTFTADIPDYNDDYTVNIRFTNKTTAPSSRIIPGKSPKIMQLIKDVEKIKQAQKKAKKKSEIMETLKLIENFNKKYNKILFGEVKFTFTKEKLQKKLKKFEKQRKEDLITRIQFLLEEE